MKNKLSDLNDEELAWLEENHRMVISEYHAAFCAQFNRCDVSATNLHSLRKRKGWKTGRTGQFPKGNKPYNKGKPHPARGRAAETQFKKGHKPHNTNYLGHERVSKEGYVEISVDEVNPHTGFERRYVLKHRWLWEKKHGSVPKGKALKCLDGDKTNCDPSNWEAIPRALLPRLNGGKAKRTVAFDDAPDELKPVILSAAKLEHAVREKRKGDQRGKDQ
ncbi:hypothetical protein MXMO3_01754 [Maritalea myrionectae]|uniref:HNH nuclease domain-containing protein n=1 Tax=Maritalea myrionectae TaxID=454601 RepID=A0A2R4MEJ5_9HYPH|nr:HNH endonuclease signature motif containing protein [Maritalea myrionectae]AVX04279.1 hypothetical protein MXMO3_01754 [Maritalea myrionectae]